MDKTNWEKYFGNPKAAGDTLEMIMCSQLNICKNLCEFKDKDCTSDLLDNYHCNEAIKYFLQQPSTGNIIDNNRKLIECCENGFIDLQNKCFISFQSLNYIEPIKIKYSDDYDNVRFNLCSEKDVYAKITYSFIINIKDNKNFVIGYDYFMRLFNCIPRKNKLMKYLFDDKYVKNKEINKFYSEQTDIMKEDMKILEDTRNELIKKFNEWKLK